MQRVPRGVRSITTPGRLGLVIGALALAAPAAVTAAPTNIPDFSGNGGGLTMASASFSFSGSTSQGGRVKFRVTGAIAIVKNFTIGWQADCTSGASLSDGTLFPRTPVNPFPRFHASGSYKSTAAHYSAANGRTLSYAVAVHLRGILPRNAHAHGTWTAKVQVLDATGTVIDNCATGVVDWHTRLS